MTRLSGYERKTKDEVLLLRAEVKELTAVIRKRKREEEDAAAGPSVPR